MPWTKDQLVAANEMEQFLNGRVSATLRDGMKWEKLGLAQVWFEDGTPHISPSLAFQTYLTDGTQD